MNYITPRLGTQGQEQKMTTTITTQNNGSVLIETDHMPVDVNRFVSRTLKNQRLPVVGTAAQLLVRSEPGRTWTKTAEQSSVVAHG